MESLQLLRGRSCNFSDPDGAYVPWVMLGTMAAGAAIGAAYGYSKYGDGWHAAWYGIAGAALGTFPGVGLQNVILEIS